MDHCVDRTLFLLNIDFQKIIQHFDVLLRCPWGLGKFTKFKN